MANNQEQIARAELYITAALSIVDSNLTEPGSNLTLINVGETNASDAGAVALASNARRLPRLAELGLGRAGLGAEGGEALGSLARDHPALRLLRPGVPRH